MKKIIMKKILLTLSMAITMSSAWAAKAINKPITIQQSDGTLITVYLHGDEDFHWYTSADGTDNRDARDILRQSRERTKDERDEA